MKGEIIINTHQTINNEDRVRINAKILIAIIQYPFLGEKQSLMYIENNTTQLWYNT